MNIYRFIIATFLCAILLVSGCASTDNTVSPKPDNAPHTDALNYPNQPTFGAGAHQKLSKVMREAENDKIAKEKTAENKNSHKTKTKSKTAKPKNAAQTQLTIIKPTSQPKPNIPATSSTELAPAAGPAYPIAGMVGQVNGQAIYADNVFKPINEQLKSLSKRVSGQEFVNRAKQLITNRLRQIVADNLILSKAMLDLTPGEKMALDHYVRLHREKLIKQYGRGSVAVAQNNIKKETGHTLDQEVSNYKKSVVVQRYLHFKLMPRINVTRRAIRRYYHNNWAQFHSPTIRTLRIMRIEGKNNALKAKQELKSGKPFKEVASQKFNSYNRSGGGSMGKQQGDNILRGELNDTMLKLKAGQWAGPIKMSDSFWFVQVEKITKAKSQSLEEAQLKIQSFLRDQQFRKLSSDFREKLFENGSYNSIDQMTKSLLVIAISRYASGENNE